MAYLQGMDVSRWQGTVDWKKAKAAGIEFAFTRASVSDYYTDPMCLTNIQGMQDNGILWGAYMVLRDTETAKDQVDKFYESIGNNKPDLPVVMDCELRNTSPEAMMNTIEQVSNLVVHFDGRLPIYYSNLSYTNYLGSPLWLSRHYLWIANYTNKPEGPSDESITGYFPAMPSMWNNKYLFWQWSADKNGLGEKYGAESADIDLNRFKGTIEDLRAFAGLEPPKAESWLKTLLKQICGALEKI